MDGSATPDASTGQDASVDTGSTLFDAGSVDASEADGGAGVMDAGGSVMDAGGSPMLRLPTPNVRMDYQLGGAYPPPGGTMWLSRDRNASIVPGLYNVCYVNGFQTQPDERSFWEDQHPDLLLRDGSGRPVIDPDWDELILDVSTAPKRSALAEIVGAWIEGCASSGFDAVEIDNLDTYSRSGGRLQQDHAVAFMRLLSDIAHDNGLAIAQKNSTEVLDRRADMGTDFAIAEECNRWDECGDYTDEYGDLVFVIEYRRGDFDQGCTDFPELSIVLRDLNLVAPSSPAYTYDDC